MSSLTAAFAPTMERAPLRVILASAIGSALEWYDFFLYGTAAALVFGEAFFPGFDPLVGVLLSFASFGVGFVARPFGGLVFGYLGDRHGRKPVLIATLLLVGIGTVLIGCLPTYAMIGVWAPILLVLLRLAQGFGAGAEYGGAVILLVEYAPPGHRGLWGAFAPLGVAIGNLLAAGAFAVVSKLPLAQGFGAGAEYGGAVILLVEYAPPGHRGLWGAFAPLGVAIGNLLAAGAFAVVSKLPREQFMSWGWRLPFLLSIVLVLVGFYIRYRVMETPVFREAVARRAVVARENPVVESIRRQPRSFFVLIGARVAENGLGYLFPVFGLAYVTTTLGVNKSAALNALIVAYMVELITIPVFSALSDRMGRRPVYLFGALCGIALAVPFFLMVGTRHWLWITLAFVLSRAVVIAAMFGPQAAYFAELFAPTRRYSGFAFARELGSVLAGGPAPFVATALVAWAGGSWWPVALYIVLLSGVTAFAVWCGPETYRDDISVDASEPALETLAAVSYGTCYLSPDDIP